MYGMYTYAPISSMIKVVASFNIVTYGISPPRFLADPDIDPATVYSINDVAPDCRFPAAAIVELRGDWKWFKDARHHSCQLV